MKAILLSFPHKLAIRGASKTSRLYFCLFYLCLMASTTFPIVGTFLALMICPLILIFEKARKKPHSFDALRLGMQRLVLFAITGAFSDAIYFNILESHGNPTPFWNAQMFIMMSLAFSDFIFSMRGQIGYFYIQPKATSRTAQEKKRRTSALKQFWMRLKK